MKTISVRKANSALRALGTQLGLKEKEGYDLRSSKVNGETESVTFHSEHLYIMVMMQENPHVNGGVLIRGCKHRKDYGGTNNQFVQYEALDNAETLAKRIQPILEAKGQGIAFLR